MLEKCEVLSRLPDRGPATSASRRPRLPGKHVTGSHEAWVAADPKRAGARAIDEARRHRGAKNVEMRAGAASLALAELDRLAERPSDSSRRLLLDVSLVNWAAMVEWYEQFRVAHSLSRSRRPGAIRRLLARLRGPLAHPP